MRKADTYRAAKSNVARGKHTSLILRAIRIERGISRRELDREREEMREGRA